MTCVSIVSDSMQRAERIRRHVAGVLASQILTLNDLATTPPTALVVGDMTMTAANIATLKAWLAHRPKKSQVIFVVDKDSRLQAMQACALGATDLLDRPVERKALLAILLGETDSLAGLACELPVPQGSAVSSGITALQNIFAVATGRAPLEPQALDTAAQHILEQIAEQGCLRWIETVRNHHSQTYQHCLIVTGVAATFGRFLGFAQADQQKLTSAALLHDIGKAKIPLSILEKPGPLDAQELAVMRQHPVFGFEALQAAPGLKPDMLDVVVHHHEYLDGSGYPHGLGAAELSDLVRVMTIADVFGALIERRSYKPPLSGEAAFEILVDMGQKLDQDLVRAFRPLSRAQFG